MGEEVLELVSVPSLQAEVVINVSCLCRVGQARRLGPNPSAQALCVPFNRKAAAGRTPLL